MLSFTYDDFGVVQYLISVHPPIFYHLNNCIFCLLCLDSFNFLMQFRIKSLFEVWLKWRKLIFYQNHIQHPEGQINPFLNFLILDHTHSCFLQQPADSNQLASKVSMLILNNSLFFPILPFIYLL